MANRVSNDIGRTMLSKKHKLTGECSDECSENSDESEAAPVEKKLKRISAYIMFLGDPSVRTELARIPIDPKDHDERRKCFAATTKAMAQKWAELVAKGETARYEGLAAEENERRFQEPKGL